MKISQQIEFKIWGSDILEAHFLDEYLSTFKDGLPRNIPPVASSIINTMSRVETLLLSDAYLSQNQFDNSFAITSKGILHLNKGGYKWEVKYAKLSKYTFSMSIVALMASLASILWQFTIWLRN